MAAERRVMDLEAYAERARNGPCFVCAFLAGDPGYPHHIVHEDQQNVAFLDRWPTLPGKVLVAPKAHVEHVVRELDEGQYTRLMLLVRAVALAVEEVFRVERTYLYSLGSQQGNSHLHWHIAALPPGVPYDEQQFHALMTETDGVLDVTPEDMADTAARIRSVLRVPPGQSVRSPHG